MKSKKSKSINPQGIKKTKEIRGSFPLADNINYTLCGGDFDSFEVTLAEAYFKDEKLREQLLKKVVCPICQGKKKVLRGKKAGSLCDDCNENGMAPISIHALFGEDLFPPMTYEQIMASKGTEDDKYTLSKSGVFSKIYGGDENTLANKMRVTIEVAREANSRFERRFPGIAKARRFIWDNFASMRQPGGIGKKVEWHEPKDYVESMFGFCRYFILENQICKALYNLANNPPKDWRNLKITVKRDLFNNRIQWVGNAVQSALFAAAFNIQGQNCRAASNHIIQSSGATITKHVQRKIWDLQPSGVHEWVVQPMNIHDEIMCVVKKGEETKVKKVVDETVESFRPKVPLIGMDWKSNMKNWAEK